MVRFARKLTSAGALVLSMLAPVQADQATLLAERAVADYAATLPAGSAVEILQVSHTLDHALGVAEFWMDPRTGRFLANVISDHGAVQRVSGFMQFLVPMPVPTRRLMPGEVIGPRDITMAQVATGSIGTFAIATAETLPGMEVRRMLEAGRPIMEQSVMKPFAVARGSKVTIAFDHGAMRLSAPGRALADAHVGDHLRVVNLSSNKTITATARADGVVEVLK